LADQRPVIERFEPYEIPGKSWGTELVVAQTDKYLGKVLLMRAGGTGALQYHVHKDETFFLYSGDALVEYALSDGELRQHVMRPGEAFHVPPGAVHRVEALTDCVLVETSSLHFDDRVVVSPKGLVAL
jgi:mannose-6-phosphate isomerase-like protein (cupin superfamily)